MLHRGILLTCVFLGALAVHASAAENEPKTDRHGDALPAGAVARLGTVRWRQGAEVSFAAFLPDGKTVVSVGDDQTICLWEFPSGKPIRRVSIDAADQSPGGPLWLKTRYLAAAALSKDGKYLATTFIFPYTETHEFAIHLHELATGKELPAPKPGSSPVESMAISPDGEQLAYLTNDRFVHVWDRAKTQEISTFGGRRLVAGVDSVLYTPDGKSLLTGGHQLMLWDPATGKELQKPRDLSVNSHAHVLSQDGKELACSIEGRKIKIVETETGKEVCQLPHNEMGYPRDMVFSKDGSKLYVCVWTKEQVQEWDMTGKLLRTLNASPLTPSGVPAFRWMRGRLTLSPDGNTLLLAGPQNTAQFIDLETGKQVATASNTTNPLQALQFTPDSKTLLAWDTSATVQRWDLATSKLLGPPSQREWSIATVSPDGKYFAAQLPDAKNVLTLLDATNGKALGELTVKDRSNTIDLLFTPDSKTLAVHYHTERKIELYEVPTAKLHQTLTFATNVPDPKSQPGSRSPKTLTAVTPMTMRFSDDSKRLTCYSAANTLSLWDVNTGQQLFSKSFGAREAIDGGVFSHDQRCLAVGCDDGTATIYELATGQARRTYGKKPPQKKPDPNQDDPGLRPNEALSPDDSILVHGGTDGLVHLWDVVTGKEVAAFKGHVGAINAVAFAPNGKTLASASADTTTLLWDVSKLTLPVRAVKELSADEEKMRWQALAEADAEKAFTAIIDLAASPKEATAFLKEQVKPAVPLDMKRIQELIAKLDDEQAAVRQKATNDLIDLGEQAVPVIDKTLPTNPPLEVRKRLDEARKALTSPILKGETLRVHRAVEVLERMGTPEARQLLQALAGGAAEARQTREAKAALERLGKENK